MGVKYLVVVEGVRAGAAGKMKCYVIKKSAGAKYYACCIFEIKSAFFFCLFVSFPRGLLCGFLTQMQCGCQPCSCRPTALERNISLCGSLMER